MILDYIGQELIWDLRANHPYRLNPQQFHTYIRCRTPKQNSEVKTFLLGHLKKDWIEDIIMEDTPFLSGDDKIIREIKVRNVFGNINSITILNVED